LPFIEAANPFRVAEATTISENTKMARTNAAGRGLILAGLLLTTSLALALPPAAERTAGKPGATKTKAEQGTKPRITRIERQGVAVEFSAQRADESAPDKSLLEGEYADIRFKVSDARSRKPIRGLKPGAWLDVETGLSKKPKGDQCKGKIETFLKGVAGVRPALDLTSYYLLVFNQDASISVIDPLVGVAGRTNLFTSIILKHPPGDWAKSADGRRLYVSLPDGGLLAVVDTETFKVIDNLDVGRKPTRVALQPDGRYLWVGNDGETDEAGGVTVIDTQTSKVVARIATGKGHHELAFSGDDRYAFVSNREGGSVSVIDIATVHKVRDIKTGSQPISLAYSRQAQALYVADGADGKITVMAGSDPGVIAGIPAKSGLGPMGLSPDGRWALVLNSRENLVHVIDVATNRLAQDIPVGSRPYQLAFSDRFAYVRSLDSEQVAMISLGLLGKKSASQLSSFAAGSIPPREVPDLGIGANMTPAVGEAAYLVASPGDNLVYYYMEGMLAPSGSFRNPGHSARAITVVDRGLQETQPGVYTARVKIPTAGNYDVALLLESPRMIQCFQTQAKANPVLQAAQRPAEIDYLNAPAYARTGDTLAWRFRLDDPVSHQPKGGLKDVQVMYYLSPGMFRTESAAREVGNGVYQAELPLARTGAYYVLVGVPSLQLKYGDLPYRNVLAVAKKADAPAAAPQSATAK
jgi:YVTN family beta-propeller protein